MSTKNWFGPLLLLIRALEETGDKRRFVDRTAYAAKMWREIVAGGGVRLTLKDALVHIQRIRTYNVPLPLGTEYPDLPKDRLKYYNSEPWNGPKDDGTKVLRRDLRRGLRRIVKQVEIDAVNPPDGKFEQRVQHRIGMLLEKSERLANQVPEGDYAVMLLQQELARRTR